MKKLLKKLLGYTDPPQWMTFIVRYDGYVQFYGQSERQAHTVFTQHIQRGDTVAAFFYSPRGTLLSSFPPNKWTKEHQ